MRAAHTYRGARRNTARDIAAEVPGGKMRDYFEPRVRPHRSASRTIFDNFGRKIEPRSLHYRHIIKTLRFGGREYQLHATKGWRSYAA